MAAWARCATVRGPADALLPVRGWARAQAGYGHHGRHHRPRRHRHRYRYRCHRPTPQQRRRLVAEHRAGGQPAVGQPRAGPVQVAVGLQLAQGGGDRGLALGEAGRERLDADLGPGGQRLDVYADPDRGEESPSCCARWLPTIVKRLACGNETWMTPEDGRGPGIPVRAWVRAISCWVAMGKVSLPWWSGPRSGLPSRRGPSHVWCCGQREHMPGNPSEIQPSWRISPMWVTSSSRS